MSPQLIIIIIIFDHCLCADSADRLLEWVTLDVPMYAKRMWTLKALMQQCGSGDMGRLRRTRALWELQL